MRQNLLANIGANKRTGLCMVGAVFLWACQLETGTQNADLTPPAKTSSAGMSQGISQERGAKIHADILTLDTHVDIPLNYITEIDPADATELQVDLGKLDRGGLDAAFFIIYTPQGELNKSGYARADKIAKTRMAAIERLAMDYPARIAFARTAEDVRRLDRAGKRVALAGMENAYPLAESVSDVRLWAGRGVRYIGITHFGHNQFGDSSNPHPVRDNGPRWNGLSPLGRDLIKAMNVHGIMVDVSHAAKSTMMQAADLSTTPIIASHSGVKAIANSARNLDDEQLRKIAAVGGVAHMVALGAYVRLPTPEQQHARKALDTAFGDRQGWDPAKQAAYHARRAEIAAMAPGASVADFVDHIDHAVKIAGIDHVGIASDFDGGGGIKGWEDASETSSVTAELVRRGYSEADIAKIWGENLLRVMEKVELAAESLSEL